MNKHLLALICIMSSSPLYADLRVLQTSDTYWECTASDNEYNQWIAQSTQERGALNKAIESCKKISKNPETCHVAKEDCSAIVNGISTRPMWQCTAMDVMAKRYKSALYTKRDDAALGAKAFCQDHSGMPDTCYINLMTCENQNKFVH